MWRRGHQRQRATIKAANPDMGVTEFAKHMGSLWQTMSDAEKQPFIDEHARLKLAYEEYIASAAVRAATQAVEQAKASERFAKEREAYIIPSRDDITKDLSTGGVAIAKQAARARAAAARAKELRKLNRGSKTKKKTKEKEKEQEKREKLPKPEKIVKPEKGTTPTTPTVVFFSPSLFFLILEWPKLFNSAAQKVLHQYARHGCQFYELCFPVYAHCRPPQF